MQPVAVIILNWNGTALLRKFLPKVLENTDSALARVIVVDNGSTDGSRKVLADEFPSVETLFFEQNYGFAEGYNRAVAEIECKYALLLNSDVAPASGWIVPLYEFMEKTPDAGACQPKLLSYNEPEMFEYAGAAGGFIDRHGFPYCRGRIFATCEKDRGQYDSVIPVDWASGAALMVRKHLFVEAGGLDPRFFAHMEEIDLCWRIRLMGYNLYCVPSSAVFHLGGGSLPPSSPRKTYLNFRNNLLMLYKNLPRNSRSKTLFRRRLLDTIAWAKFIFTMNFRNANAILKAHRDFARMRASYPVCDDCPDLLAGRPDVLAAYYLRSRHKFSDL